MNRIAERGLSHPSLSTNVRVNIPSGIGAPTRTSARCQEGEYPSAQRSPDTAPLPARMAPGVTLTPNIERSR